MLLHLPFFLLLSLSLSLSLLHTHLFALSLALTRTDAHTRTLSLSNLCWSCCGFHKKYFDRWKMTEMPLFQRAWMAGVFLSPFSFSFKHTHEHTHPSTQAHTYAHTTLALKFPVCFLNEKILNRPIIRLSLIPNLNARHLQNTTVDHFRLVWVKIHLLFTGLSNCIVTKIMKTQAVAVAWQ